MEEGRVACELGAERTVSPPSVRVKDMEYNAGWYRAIAPLSVGQGFFYFILPYASRYK